MGQEGVRRAALILAALAAMLFVDSPATARQRMSFVPGQSHAHAVSHRRMWHPTSHRHHRDGLRAGVRRRGGAAEVPVGATPPGFKMEDGVLTYPAPARFQPKNLKHL